MKCPKLGLKNTIIRRINHHDATENIITTTQQRRCSTAFRGKANKIAKAPQTTEQHRQRARNYIQLNALQNLTYSALKFRSLLHLISAAGRQLNISISLCITLAFTGLNAPHDEEHNQKDKNDRCKHCGGNSSISGRAQHLVIGRRRRRGIRVDSWRHRHGDGWSHRDYRRRSYCGYSAGHSRGYSSLRNFFYGDVHHQFNAIFPNAATMSATYSGYYPDVPLTTKLVTTDATFTSRLFML
jgi:hypothetical protein